jgi:hypothetical protein
VGASEGRTGRQRIQNLLINVPPGTGKSRIVSVFTPAWMWLRWPPFKFMFSAPTRTSRCATRLYCKDVIESEWYQDTFKPTWGLDKSQNAKSYFRNTAGGERRAKGIMSRITGGRSDGLLIDDPHDAQDAKSDT